jgi:hypothetical protein
MRSKFYQGFTRKAKDIKCKSCPFKAKCFNEDLETWDAINWDLEQTNSDPLKMDGIVKLLDDNSNVNEKRY